MELVETTVPQGFSELSRKWHVLKVFNAYRLLIIGILVAIYSFEIIPLVSSMSQRLYLLLVGYYTIFAVLSTVCVYFRVPKFSAQVHIQVLVDIIILSLLINTGMGKYSSLGVLITIAIAGGSILTSVRPALFYAATATALLLMTNFYVSSALYATAQLHWILLSSSYFLTAILMSKIARQMSASEQIAQKRGLDLAKLEQLNSYIIQRFPTGVILVNEASQIQFINNAAKRLLAIGDVRTIKALEAIAPELLKRFYAWQFNGSHSAKSFQQEPQKISLFVEFAKLAVQNETLSIMFIEDSTRSAQQAQQLKLASLGRLTASIAHELRNPLGAISHAVQLLEESEVMQKQDQRLIEIIDDHSQRMNVVIKNILQLSRGEQPHPNRFELKPWLESFIAEFSMADIEKPMIDLQVSPQSMSVSMDTSQLQQILTNLCENGLCFSLQHQGQANLSLIAGLGKQAPYLDIIDNGLGVPEEYLGKIFEPFFTTNRTGTGLGLYIAKELCEANQARLEYIPHNGSGGWFRITFYGNQS